MKKFLLILLALIVVLIAAVVAVPFLLPMDTYKQQIEAQVERATGRALKIDGPLDISLLPRLAVTAEDVRHLTERLDERRRRPEDRPQRLRQRQDARPRRESRGLIRRNGHDGRPDARADTKGLDFLGDGFLHWIPRARPVRHTRRHMTIHSSGEPPRRSMTSMAARASAVDRGAT